MKGKESFFISQNMGQQSAMLTGSPRKPVLIVSKQKRQKSKMLSNMTLLFLEEESMHQVLQDYLS